MSKLTGSEYISMLWHLRVAIGDTDDTPGGIVLPAETGRLVARAISSLLHLHQLLRKPSFSESELVALEETIPQ